jgi:6,7-dimethyl-8-ribityllumazine synthase
MVGPNDGLLGADIDGTGMRIAIVCATFNFDIVDSLRRGAVRGLTSRGVHEADIVTHWVPGAFELPVAAKTLAATGRVDAVIALGAVIRGDTPHFEYVSGEAASGLQRAALDTGVHVAFGVLTVNTVEQALERCAETDNKGEEAAVGAIMTVQTLRTIKAG